MCACPEHPQSKLHPFGEPVVLAIVGSTTFEKDPVATRFASLIIWDALNDLRPVGVVSGGADGIDKLGAKLARMQDIEVKEHFPKQRRWAPNGFKERNELIAQDCTQLLAIRHAKSTTYGSGWTADYAESLGKTVDRIKIGICTICTGAAMWFNCPTGGWWIHQYHPEDEHDAEVS